MRWLKISVPDEFDPSIHKVVVEGSECKVWQPVYHDILDKGFIGLVDFMGSDQTVVNSARVSYGAGTRRVSEDRNLIRYLIRHQHWTPVEMPEFLFHVRAPIFVFRQWHRHRAAVINEYSARYSILSDDMYMPDDANMKKQSNTNKQGGGENLSDKNAYACQLQLQHIYQECSQAYKYLLGQTGTPSVSLNTRYDLVKQFAMQQIDLLQKHNPEWSPELVTEKMINDKIAEIVTTMGLAFTDEEFQDEGLSRELARIAMPLSTYSEMYWKSDLRNIFNFIGLRSDPHAQWEIRQYSDAMLELLEPLVPVCVEAFFDYRLKGRQLSRMETEVLKKLYQSQVQDIDSLLTLSMQETGASKREITEFLNMLKN